MKLKILFAALVVTVVLLGLGVYVAIAVGSELYRARTALSGDVSDLTVEQIDAARRHLRRAADRTHSWPATILKAVPVARQNVYAVEDVARTALPLLDAGEDLTAALRGLETRRLIVDGRVRLSLLTSLQAPLRSQAAALAGFEDAIREGRSGWALPPVWDTLDDLLARVGELRAGAAEAADLVGLSGELLGADRERTYLVVLMNNSELRGAGGIPSALGTLSTRNGSLRLGAFHYATDLRGPRPYRRVEAPADFRRRFARYLADTTFWVNTTFSPDVPDVAAVASRLFEASTDTRTDGVLFIDPHGIQALMPPGSSVRVPRTDRTVGAGEFATYVYSTVYQEFGDHFRRRDALLALGRAAFSTILDGGLRDRAALESAGRAVAAGHLRVVSFDPVEDRALRALDATGEPQTSGDTLLVTAQNLGGDKLDYWSRRRVTHRCEIDEGSGRCVTQVRVVNRAPEGLPRYVGRNPNALLKNYVDVYLPARARLRAVTLDGRPADFVPQDEDDLVAIGVNLVIPRDDAATVAVDYEVPVEDRWSMTATPQPLPHDAHLRIEVSAPGGWALRGDGTLERGSFVYDGPFDRIVRVTAAPSERTGIARLWDGLARFWREPVF